MNVIIKGMEMPKNCDECGFEHRAYCFLVDTVIESNDRPDWCPLVEVPTPHGRLIDADALKVSLVFAEKTAEWAVPALKAVLMVIDEMPTIIEAEEE